MKLSSFIFSALAILTSALAAPRKLARTPPTGFVYAQDGEFKINDTAFKVGGTNAYWMFFVSSSSRPDTFRTKHRPRLFFSLRLTTFCAITHLVAQRKSRRLQRIRSVQSVRCESRPCLGFQRGRWLCSVVWQLYPGKPRPTIQSPTVFS